MMVEIDWGAQTRSGLHSDNYVRKAGLKVTRVCVFHIHNLATRTRSNTDRDQLKEMLCFCVKYELDIMGGDGNSATYKWYNHQVIPNINKAILPVVFRHSEESRLSFGQNS